MNIESHFTFATQSPAARPSSDGGWRVVFPPAVDTHNPRRRETTRVTPFANLHIGSFAHYSLKFSFSAKERDTETGLSYFGARYYSSDLSLWLSVDPMSGKYPHQSNYVYCSNNPIKIIDPNGEDEWEVNKSGHIRHVDGSEGMPDKLFAVRGFGADKFKKRTDVEGLDVDAELMKELTASERNGIICFYQSDCNQDMDEVFNYLADNTNVEWALVTIGYSMGTSTTPGYGDFLMTNHSRSSCNTAASLSIVYSKNGGLIQFKHSHPAYFSLSELICPSQIRTPSGNPNGTEFNDGDYGHKRACTKPNASPDCIFVLRHKGYERRY